MPFVTGSFLDTLIFQRQIFATASSVKRHRNDLHTRAAIQVPFETVQTYLLNTMYGERLCWDA